MSRGIVNDWNKNFIINDMSDSTPNKVTGLTPTSNRLTWKEKLSRAVHGMLGFHAVYHMLDVGLSNLFALDILRHGTNIKSYLGISLRGADPKMGGTMEAVFRANDANWIQPHCKNRFFVMPALVPRNSSLIEEMRVNRGPPSFIRMATINLLGGAKQDSLTSFFLSYLTPVLRFKFRPEEVNSPRFQPDPYMSPALFTEHSISPLRLGICGNFTQGIDRGMFQRMAKNPMKVLTGAALIAGAGYLAKHTYSYVSGAPAKKEEVSSSSVDPMNAKDPKQVALAAVNTRAGKIALFFLAMLSVPVVPPAITRIALVGGVVHFLSGRINNSAKLRGGVKEKILSSTDQTHSIDQKQALKPSSSLRDNASKIAGFIFKAWIVRSLMTM